MKAIVSTLFRVISFPHDGRIVTIDQLSFICPDWVTSLSGSYMQTISPSPHVNYVALSPMTSTSDNLDSVIDMVISSVGLLELDLLTLVTTLNMCSFQSDHLPSDEDILEAMTEFFPLTWYPSRALSSWKPLSRSNHEHSFLLCSKLIKKMKQQSGDRTWNLEHSSFPVSSSLKNETITSPLKLSLSPNLIDVELSLSLGIVFEPSFHPPVSFFSIYHRNW
jgi:hypothetical protein